MNNHTPGPWFVDEASDGSLVVRNANGRYLALVKEEEGFPDDVDNAVLMAKAPELLAENTRLRAALEKYGKHSKDCYDPCAIVCDCLCGLAEALKENH